MLRKIISDAAAKAVVEYLSPLSVSNNAESESAESGTEEAKLPLNYTEILTIIRKSKLEIFTVLEEIMNTGQTPSDEHQLVATKVSRLVAHKNVEAALLQVELETSLLTGLPNQRVGVQTIKAMIESKHPFCWTFFDLDNLKPMNLALGEHVADRLINAVGNLLKSNVRTNEADGYNDCVVHRSGDEFWLILNRADLQGGLVASQHILDKLTEKQIIIKMNEEDMKYTLAIGVRLQTMLEEGKPLKDFERAAIPFIDMIKVQAAQQEKENLTARRVSDQSSKIYFIAIAMSASMGCTEYSEKMYNINNAKDVNAVFDSMSSRIKSAEEKAKMDGRNCVRAFDGRAFFKLTHEKTAEKIVD